MIREGRVSVGGKRSWSTGRRGEVTVSSGAIRWREQREGPLWSDE